MSEARVVDLPDPTHPVMSTSPAFLSEKLLITSGIPRVSNSGISVGIVRNTSPKPPFCLKAFTLSLPCH